MVAEKLTLSKPCLCLVTDRRLCPDGSLAERVAQAVAGGVTMVQLREKDLPRGPLLALARELRERIAGRALLMINERADVALVAGADGVHLGKPRLVGVRRARDLASPGMLVGRSVHSVEAAIQAEEEGADYLIVGTVFRSPSHPGQEPQGPALVRQVVQAVRVPVLGIGGVTADNAAEVLQAGAVGVAVVSAILAAQNPTEAARALASAMQNAATLRAWAPL